jgi:omega-6 fatty acid desaturase (delta-12 desaturase)
MSAGEYAAATPFRRFVERIYRGPWGPIFYYCAEFWLPRLILPVAPESRKDWRRHLPDSLFAIAGFALTIAAICLLGRSLAPERPFWITLAIAWALPFTLWNYVLGLSFYLNHTHPDIPWFSDPNIWKRHEINVSGTVHVKFPREVPLLYAQAMVHTAHHVDRSVPVYGLPESQAALARRFGRSATEYVFSLREYRRILSICKLFDFERMCWTDFSGKPTAWTTAAAHRDHRASAAQLA